MKRPMMLLFLCIFSGCLIFRPLILRPYEREREAFLTLYENKEQSCIVLGEVKDVLRGKDQTILILKDCTISGFEENVARKCGGVRLYVEGEGDFFPGNVVRAYGGIKVFLSAQNPGQFDAYEYYRREHLYANVYAEKINVVSDRKNDLKGLLVSARLAFRESFERLYPEDEAGVIFALVTGDKSLLTEDTKDDFKKAGISHILAVSGLHISFICLGFNELLKRLTVSKKFRDALTVLFTLVFVLFTGAGISVIRAGIMCIYMLLAENLKKKYDLLSGLFFAGSLELCIYPLEGTTAAFLLSYSAIFGVYGATKIRAGAGSGLVISLFTLPVTLFFYYEFNPYGVLASLLVIPVTGVTLGMALLSGVLGMMNVRLGLFPAGTAYALVKWMEWVSSFMQKLPFAMLTVGKPSLIGIVIYYVTLSIGIWAIGRYREEAERAGRKGDFWKGIFGKSGRVGNGTESGLRRKDVEDGEMRLMKVLVAVAGISIVSMVVKFPGYGMTFLSVGQGDGIVYHSRQTVIFDCGSSSESAVGKYILSPFLKRMGVKLVDMAVVSHMDSDHTSGILEILESMPVYRGDFDFSLRYKGNIGIKRLVLPQVEKRSAEYEKMVTLANEKGVEVFFIEQGDEIGLRGAKMKCLWPKDAKESANETSLVMVLATGKKAYLLTGDATTEAEEGIVRNYPEGMRALARSMGFSPTYYILKVGHHGSKTSTGETLLKWGDFDKAVISVGHFNTYGHPRPEILERLYEAGIEVHRTDKEGAVRE